MRDASPTVQPLIRRATTADLPALAEILVDVVAGGGSMGFLAGLEPVCAEAWWRARLEAVELTLVAELEGTVVGTGQLVPATPENARHRAEVAKLMVHSRARRRGVARALMLELESMATALGRSLLVLDTEAGSDAERLYNSLGWHRVGEIPGYAGSPVGGRHATALYWKELGV